MLFGYSKAKLIGTAKPLQAGLEMMSVGAAAAIAAFVLTKLIAPKEGE